jgi:acetolactate synthase I/II/III large subunit
MTVKDSPDVPEAAANLIALLADEGVSHFFINPGTDSAPLQEALAAARAAGTPAPQPVLCVHESVALAAAIGHHMVSGQPQAAMVHVDAGTLNLGCQIHNAQRNRTPVVVPVDRSPSPKSMNASTNTGSMKNPTTPPTTSRSATQTIGNSPMKHAATYDL